MPAVVPAAIPATELARAVEALGRAEGLDAVGIAPAEPLLRARAALVARKAEGLHAGMAFTYRNPERSTDPGGLVAGARAVVVAARRYPSLPPPPPEGSEPAGRVARYAWADHYAPLRASLRVIASHLRAAGHRAVVFADDNSLVDREAAYLAGIGWFGKNANLLLPGGGGSWFVLGCIVTSAPLPPTRSVVPDGCGGCRRCLDGCPTGAIVAPGVVDANRCLAWLVQKPGAFAREYREVLGDRIYGCDDCQEVCPPNIRVDRAGHGAGAAPPEGAATAPTAPAAPAAPAAPTDPTGAEDGRPVLEAWVALLELLRADDETLLSRHGRWYLAGREPRWLRRNALVALGNTADPRDERVVRVLAEHLRHDDALLRAHAAWAARRLGRADLLVVLADDTSVEVRAELASPPPAVRRHA